MQLLDKITYAFNQLIRPNPSSVVVGETKQVLGEVPEVNFKDLWNKYITDPTAQNSVNATRDFITGPGFYITAEVPRAVEIINEFCDGIDFDEILYDWVGEALVCGISFLEMLTPDNLQDLRRVDITTVKKMERDQYGEPTAIVQEIDGMERKLDPKRFVPFRLFEVARKPFPIGMLHSLAVPQVANGKLRPSIFESWNTIRDAMVKILENYSDPEVVYVFEGASDTFLRDMGKQLKEKEKGSKLLVNKKFDAHEIKLDPRARFESYITAIRTEMELGSQTPAAKLQTTTGYTEASSRAVIELVERRIMAIQRKLRRIIEKEIFDRVLLAENIDPKRAKLELHWGQPDIPTFEIRDVFRASQIQIQGKPLITWEEAREILKQSGWKLTEKNVEETGETGIQLTEKELEDMLRA